MKSNTNSIMWILVLKLCQILMEVIVLFLNRGWSNSFHPFPTCLTSSTISMWTKTTQQPSDAIVCKSISACLHYAPRKKQNKTNKKQGSGAAINSSLTDETKKDWIFSPSTGLHNYKEHCAHDAHEGDAEWHNKAWENRENRGVSIRELRVSLRAGSTDRYTPKGQTCLYVY